MDIHITNKTNKSWEAVYVIEKIRQLFSKHRVSKVVSSVCNAVCLHNASFLPMISANDFYFTVLSWFTDI